MPWTDREGPIHRACLRYLQASLPGAMIHHGPNEFGMSGKAVARQIAKHKGMGMVPGWPDLEVVYRGRLYFFEVKSGGNGLTPAQKDVRAALEAQGVPYAVVRSVDDVAEALTDWGLKKARHGDDRAG